MAKNRVLLLLVPVLLAAAMTLPAAAEKNEDTQLNVSVVRECQMEQNQFTAPGNRSVVINGTEYSLNVIGQNETDAFDFDVYNTGNRNATVTVNLTVTNQTESWEPGEEWGNFINLTKQEEELNESYDPFTLETTYYIPPGESAVGNTYYLITKLFKAIYPTGHYTGRLRMNYTCPNIDHQKNISNDANFMILESEVLSAAGTGEQEGGTRGDTPSDTPFPSQANQTGNVTSNTTAPRDANQTGNYTTNVTAPEEPGVVGNESTNTTIERDANRTGEQGQNVEGDNNQPGVTPQPEPEPEPEPEPTLEIEITPLEDEYDANQSQFAPVELRVENVGDQTAEGFEVDPLIDQIRDGWEVRPAQIAELGPGENITREVFVRPPDTASPGLYVSPVVARNDERRLDIDYFTVRVRQADFTSQISIQEAPQSLRVDSNSTQTLPVLIENTGEEDLTNVTARLQNAESCAASESASVDSIGVNESESLSLSLETTAGRSNCNSTLIISSDEGAYAFSSIDISTVPDEGLIPVRHRVPFLAIVWTLVLAGYAVFKKRYDLEAVAVKAPFIMLLMGETVIILYLIVNYYGIVNIAFLPF